MSEQVSPLTDAIVEFICNTGYESIPDDVKARIFYEGTARLYGLESPLKVGGKK